MKPIKVSEASGAVLDWMVCYAKNGRPPIDYVPNRDNFSTCWNKGGPIIQRERIDLDAYKTDWEASMRGDAFVVSSGPTPLIAAMRCYCASKLGDTVEVPEELL